MQQLDPVRCLAKMETWSFHLLIDTAFELPLFSAMCSNRDKRESGESNIKIKWSHFVSSFLADSSYNNLDFSVGGSTHLCIRQVCVSLPPWWHMPQWDRCPVSPCPMQLGLEAEQCWGWVVGLGSSTQTKWPLRHGSCCNHLLQSLCGGTHAGANACGGSRRVSLP